MQAKGQLIDDAATIASELAELCREGDVATLMYLFEMAAVAAELDKMPAQPVAAPPRRAASARRSRSRHSPAQQCQIIPWPGRARAASPESRPSTEIGAASRAD